MERHELRIVDLDGPFAFCVCGGWHMWLPDGRAETAVEAWFDEFNRHKKRS